MRAWHEKDLQLEWWVQLHRAADQVRAHHPDEAYVVDELITRLAGGEEGGPALGSADEGPRDGPYARKEAPATELHTRGSPPSSRWASPEFRRTR